MSKSTYLTAYLMLAACMLSPPLWAVKPYVEHRISDVNDVTLLGEGTVTLKVGSHVVPKVVIEGDRQSAKAVQIKDVIHQVGIRIYPQAHITIFLKQCQFLQLGEQVKVKVSGTLSSDTLKITLKNQSQLVTRIKTKQLTIQLSDASKAQIFGKTIEQQAVVKEHSILNGKDLTSQQSVLSITGSGQIMTHTKKTLEVNIQGKGVVQYTGLPKINEHLSGGGEIIPIR